MESNMKLPLNYKLPKDAIEILKTNSFSSEDILDADLEIFTEELTVNRRIYSCEGIYDYFDLMDILQAVDSTLKHFNNKLRANVMFKHDKNNYYAFNIGVDELTEYLNEHVE